MMFLTFRTNLRQSSLHAGIRRTLAAHGDLDDVRLCRGERTKAPCGESYLNRAVAAL
jgi:hypothetical protein